MDAAVLGGTHAITGFLVQPESSEADPSAPLLRHLYRFVMPADQGVRRARKGVFSSPPAFERPHLEQKKRPVDPLTVPLYFHAQAQTHQGLYDGDSAVP